MPIFADHRRNHPSHDGALMAMASLEFARVVQGWAALLAPHVQHNPTAAEAVRHLQQQAMEHAGCCGMIVAFTEAGS